MGRRRRSWVRMAIRASDIVFDPIGIRPLGIVVFGASALLLVQMIGFTQGALRADAVALAKRVDHPSRVSSFVTAVFVKPGSRVEVGAPLAELSPHFINQSLARIDSEIEQLINESKLEQARLLVDEERYVAQGVRLRPNRPSLQEPTEAYYAKQFETRRVQRSALIADLDSLTVKSNYAGVVAEVVWLGASVAAGASVASVMPEYAEEIVAYVDPTTDPSVIAMNTKAYIVGAETTECRLPGRVRRLGAAVRMAPPQMTNFMQVAVHGTPVHISLPEACKISNGRVLEIDFEKKSTS